MHVISPFERHLMRHDVRRVYFASALAAASSLSSAAFTSAGVPTSGVPFQIGL